LKNEQGRQRHAAEDEGIYKVDIDASKGGNGRVSGWYMNGIDSGRWVVVDIGINQRKCG